MAEENMLLWKICNEKYRVVQSMAEENRLDNRNELHAKL